MRRRTTRSTQRARTTGTSIEWASPTYRPRPRRLRGGRRCRVLRRPARFGETDGNDPSERVRRPDPWDGSSLRSRNGAIHIRRYIIAPLHPDCPRCLGRIHCRGKDHDSRAYHDGCVPAMGTNRGTLRSARVMDRIVGAVNARLRTTCVSSAADANARVVESGGHIDEAGHLGGGR